MAEVLPVQVPDGQSYYTSSGIRRSPNSQTSLFIGTPPYSPRNSSKYVAPAASAESYSQSSSTSSSSSSRTSQVDLTNASSFASTVSSSLTLDTSYDLDDDTNFTLFNGGGYMNPYEDDEPPSPRTDNSYTVPSPTSESTPTHTPDTHIVAEDDTAIRQHPSRHVDYLSHDWKEEDIWSSWRHIVSKRRLYGERSRLENASWRTWAKQKYRLRTIPPDSLNWLKDCDVTWLYGPLQTATSYSVSQPAYSPSSHLSRTNSHANLGQHDIDEVKKKPILKKRSMSEVMLQKSISASSLVKQAAAAVQAERDLSRPRLRDNRPMFGRATSDFVTSAYPSHTISRDTVDTFSSSTTSDPQTPDHGEKRHIRFADKVDQCIAIDGKGNDDEDEPAYPNNDSDSDDSDDGVLMMSSKTNRKKPISRSNSKTDLSEKTLIVNLEPTTLKYRTDSPDVPELPSHSVGPSFWRRGNISPSPSQETLRPAHPSRNFLLEDDDDENDLSWEPSGAFADRRDKSDREEDNEMSHSGGLGGMRRTASGMLMPYEEGDEAHSSGLFGKVVDTVNTAKDIAHVIWNVGWRP
ncbi:hypothetical protein FKW77_009965 [Venturia effusa]|uniref:Nitrogen regulatory protein areA GATA-like domain-containing protein n=1 Tax=Venturia effusa TaxID=50376 RepID=A0A517KXF9_9PEZI|nr:hypothetical protein FKW77_009965 [Venturia effusa]